jgi:hypothetical protein
MLMTAHQAADRVFKPIWTVWTESFRDKRKGFKMQKTLITAISILFLTSCATPITVLKNPKTGQVARCGGERSGAMMGGMIGYSLQEGDAKTCVENFEAQGFNQIK